MKTFYVIIIIIIIIIISIIFFHLERIFIPLMCELCPLFLREERKNSNPNKINFEVCFKSISQKREQDLKI